MGMAMCDAVGRADGLKGRADGLKGRAGQAAKGKEQSSARRCAECDVKLSISACIHATCRCGQSFCAAHMHEHKCTYDYRTRAQERLRTGNPKLMPSKMSNFV